MASHERLLKHRACAIQFSSKAVKTCLCSKIAWKPTIQPMMKFSQLICWGESRLEPKFLKNLQDRFWAIFDFTFSLFAKNLSYRFLVYFVWMFNQTQFRVPEMLIVQISRRMVKVNSEGKNSLEPFSKELKVVLLYSIKTVVSHLKVIPLK